MVDIPLDKDYLRKHYPDKYKELEKNKASSPTPQSKVEKGEVRHGCPEPKGEDLVSKGFGLIADEFNKVLKGDIKRPTEFDEFISENPKSSDELVLSQTAWLAKTSAYIAMHLKRWAEERVVREIDHWYRNVSNPFTKRLAVINVLCEDLLDTLSARLPNLQNRFKEQYEQLLFIAKNADKEQNLVPGINNFKKMAIRFHGTVMTIHSEAVMRLDKLTKPASGKAGEKPEPLSQNAQIVYEILSALPPHKAMRTPEILDEVSKKHNKYWDEKELYNRVFPQLKKWGLRKKARIGYWIEK